MSVALPEFSPGDWDSLKHSIDVLQRNARPPLPQARVYNTANINTANGVPTTLTFDSELFDNGNLHSTAVNTSRLTAKITGLYTIGLHISIEANAVGIRQTRIVRNGALIIAIDLRPAAAGDATQVSLTTLYRLTAGDYVEAVVYQNSGGNLLVQATGNYSMQFWMKRDGGHTNEGIA